ncbi:MAG TPA: CRTAC1 family protein, partial [Verrucomicrobiae bacterium]|nr:CRTAC1 family protein [Verrucomicrobiae bacterium]
MINKPTHRPDEGHDELVHADDRVIGRAVKGSAIALLLVAAIAGGAIWVLKRKPDAPLPKVTPLSAPTTANRTTAEVPAVQFTDVTAASGIRFKHYNGAYGEKLLPETMGGGVGVFDFDNDGAQDLLFVDGAAWPWREEASGRPTTLALYRNDGK